MLQNIKKITFVFVFLFWFNYSFASVSLPFESTFNCSENTDCSAISCDGWERYSCNIVDGHYGEIIGDANYPLGEGGLGYRGRFLDTTMGTNHLSLRFDDSQTEVWVRFYMKYNYYDASSQPKTLYFMSYDVPGNPAWFVFKIFPNGEFLVGENAVGCGGGNPGDCKSTSVPSPTDLDWHEYEIHVKTGGAGVADFEVWIDGVPVEFANKPEEYTLNWGGRSNIDGFDVNVNANYATLTGSVDYDDFVVSNLGYIGPIETDLSCVGNEVRSCNTGELGVCSSGTQICQDSFWGECIRDSDPVEEICGDGIDQDCDGFDLDCLVECLDGEILSNCLCRSVETDVLEEYSSGFCIDGYWNETNSIICLEDWNCSEWDSCVDGFISRSCVDMNSCGTVIEKPVEISSCSLGGSLCDDVVAWFDLDGNVLDSSALSNDGSFVFFNYTVGRFNQAASFNGFNVIVVDNVSSFLGFDEFTISAWINPSDYGGSGDSRIVHKANGQWSDDYALNYLSDGRIQGRIYTSSINYIYSDLAIEPNSEWHNVILIWDGDYAQIYIDGVASGVPVDVMGSLVDSDGVLAIGKHALAPGIDRGFFGDVDEVLIFNRALNVDEISDLQGDVFECNDSLLFSCSQLGGFACMFDEVCLSGVFLNASDSFNCCDIPCDILHEADEDESGKIEFDEVIDYANSWVSGEIEMGDLIEVIKLWSSV